jgi:hypothetical protein
LLVKPPLHNERGKELKSYRIEMVFGHIPIFWGILKIVRGHKTGSQNATY